MREEHVTDEEESGPKPILGVPRRGPDMPGRKGVVDLEPRKAWSWVGWFGLLLAFQALGDFLLTFYPLRFGSPEWEFGTIAAAFSGLPLIAVGIACMLAAGIGLRRRWLILAMGIVLAIGALTLAALNVIFLLDVPLALKGSRGVAALGVEKAIARTGFLGVGFMLGCALASVATLRTLRRKIP